MTTRTLLVFAAIAGCAPQTSEVRVGAKDFVEQRILAAALARIASQNAPTTIVDCGDTFRCQQMMRADEIDLMVDYSGTAMLYSGAVLGRQPDPEVLRKRLAALGLRWATPLGFENGYRVVMSRNRAAELDIESIADLAEHANTLRFAVPRSYLSRPSDSYGALLARHGITPSGPPLIVDNTALRLDAILTGRADVAIAYGTDGDVRGLPLSILSDSLGFFPRYEATVVMREEFAARSPETVAIIDKLRGTIDVATMQALNYEVGTLGVSAYAAANKLLAPLDLDGDRDDERKTQGPPLNIAVATSDALDSVSKKALRMIRSSFKSRRLTVERFDDPIWALTHGKARLAILGAERFFEMRDDQLAAISTVEAAAVSGSRVIHLVRGLSSSGTPLDGRIGIGQPGSGSAIVGERLLRVVGAEATAAGDIAELLGQVAAGDLDGAILLTEIGDPAIEEALAAGTIELNGLDDPAIRSRMPHLRPARIPRNSYSGQDEVLESLSAQVVIAGPAPQTKLRPGPTAALARDAAQPLTVEEAKALAEAIDSVEAPDASLPSVWGRGELVSRRDTAGVAALDTLLNVATIAFLGWLIVLVLRRETE